MPLPQTRIKHLVVLMLENRSFDHLFGFMSPAAGQTLENLLGGNEKHSNRLDPETLASASNPEFTVTTPAPFAVHDKEGPSHSFNAVCVQLCNDKAPVRNTSGAEQRLRSIVPRRSAATHPLHGSRHEYRSHAVVRARSTTN